MRKINRKSATPNNITKREFFAGLIASQIIGIELPFDLARLPVNEQIRRFARASVKLSDAIIKELNKKTK